MIELHGRHVPEEVPPRRLEHQDLGRNDRAVHQRERVVREACADAGDEAAGDDHRQHQRESGDRPAPRGPCLVGQTVLARRGWSSESATQSIAPKIRNASVRCAVRRNCETRGSSTSPLLHHVPAERALQAAEREDAGELPPVASTVCAAASQTTTSGTRNATPISRPSRRCAYSHQKMRLNASSVIPLFTCRYSGVCRYLSNATCQSASESGGSVADDRLPLGDRQARVREARDAADDDDREHERAAGEQPCGDCALRRRGRQPAPAVRRDGERGKRWSSNGLNFARGRSEPDARAFQRHWAPAFAGATPVVGRRPRAGGTE